MVTPQNGREAARARRTEPHEPSCAGCSARWTGTAACHCAADGCHYTFTGITAFDAHRRRGRCLEPTAAGLVVNERGRWGSEPMSETARDAIRKGQR